MIAKRALVSSLFMAAAAIGFSCAPQGEPPRSGPAPGTKSDLTTIAAPVPASLKDRIDAALENVHRRDLLTSHAFWTVFHGILGMGLEQTKLFDTATGQRYNAIDYVRKGGPIRGMVFVPMGDAGL